jgi:(p)ppGpp synthase/HD superfamily hydrolase
MDVAPPFVANRPLARAALEWAEALHSGQQRVVDHAPFILHPAEVAAVLSLRGYDDEVIAAGLLHDAVEGSDADLADVQDRFGARVARIVGSVSEDPGIDDYVDRKAALRAQVAAADHEAHAVFAADKLVKARELRAQAVRSPAALDEPDLQRRLEHYEASLAMLQRVAPTMPILHQLAFELWALRALPPAPIAARHGA